MIHKAVLEVIVVVAALSGAGLSSLIPVTVSYAQNSDAHWQEIRALIRAGDSLAIAEVIARQGDPQTVAGLYNSIVRDLYYNAHDLKAVVLVAQKGIDYCLSQAVQASGRHQADLADEFRGRAKDLAYNLGSYTWPGWDEPGIQIQPLDRALGFAAARLNLRFGEELDRGPAPMSTAYWLLGAHALAAGEFAEAIEYFQQSAELARSGGERSAELLSQGFEGIAKVASRTAVEEGERELNQTKIILGIENIADAAFWIDQLDTAYRVFVQE